MVIDKLLAKVIGTQNERELKRLRRSWSRSTPWSRRSRQLSDEQLRAKTAEFRQRLAKGETLDDLLPEAFAVVREAGRRTLNMRHFDVQLIGGMVLHRGKIAEMKTGEGKTLVATLPAYLNALDGKGVHVVTVNDYLARRDSEWMGRIYRFLGMTVGVIQHDLNDAERQVAYACDITYGTNNEFGFDYLRDNMKFDLAHYVQRGHHFAIVDEVDSILIDEARTPLIISGPAEESTDLYYEVDRIIPRLSKGRGHARRRQGRRSRGAREDRRLHRRREAQDGHADRERHGQGREAARRIASCRAATGLYDPAEHAAAPPHQPGAARAHAVPARRRLHDQGRRRRDRRRVHRPPDAGPPLERRPAPGGRGQGDKPTIQVKIERENQTLATITFQNYFRKYKKLSGMTGTADTEAEEFAKIYKLDVMVIPTNRQLRRIEEPDIVYRTERRSTTRSSTTSSRSRSRAGRCSSARSRSRSPSGSRSCSSCAASSTSC